MPNEADPAASSQSRIVPCPRCAYDLGGVIERWKRDTVAGGPCSECGLDIEWKALLSRSRREKELEVSRAAGFFEIGSDRLAARFWRTSLRAAFPPAMFPWITEKQPVRSPRVGSFLCIWLVAWFGVGVLPGSLTMALAPDPIAGEIILALFTLQSGAVYVVWLISLLCVRIFTLDPFRPHRSSVSLDHFVRTAVYGLCGLMCVQTIAGVLPLVISLVGLVVGYQNSAYWPVPIVALLLLPFAFYIFGWCLSWCVVCTTDYFRATKAENAWLFPLLSMLLAIAAVAAIMMY